jgi:hypothetical protein
MIMTIHSNGMRVRLEASTLKELKEMTVVAMKTLAEQRKP